MSDYTPTIKELRDAWVYGRLEPSADPHEVGAEFDRCLAAFAGKVERQAYATGLERRREAAAKAVDEYMEHESFCWTDRGPKCICQKDGAVAAARGESEKG